MKPREKNRKKYNTSSKRQRHFNMKSHIKLCCLIYTVTAKNEKCEALWH